MIHVESINQIAKIFNVSNSVIKRWCREYEIKIETTFDRWKLKYDYIQENLSFFVQENKEKSLLEIAKEHSISIEQLKRIFNENNIPVVLHSYNKSKGELEILDFVKSLGVDAKSIKMKHENIRFELDCYVPSANIAIEYCGEYWHSIIDYI